MRTLNKSKGLPAVMILGLFVASAVQATNGYFTHGYSTKEKGVAGAGVAYSQDALAAATNPAGMAFVGERIDIGLALFNPSDRSFTLTGTQNPFMFANAVPGEQYISDNDFFLIPQFAINWQMDSNSTIGISFYANGGMNTEYPASATTGGAGIFGNPAIPFNAGNAGIDLEQGFVNVTIARKSSDDHAVGVGLVMAGQRFAAQGLDAFGGFSVDGSNMSGNRHSTSLGAGFKIGYQGKVVDGLSVGVSYQSKITMSEFNEYQGLFAQGGGFDIPETYTYGLVYDLGSPGKVLFDVQRINYSNIASIANPVQNIYNCPAMVAMMGGTGGDASYCFGGANGAGFGWQDMTIMKLGYEIAVGGNTYRVGYSKGDMPIPESQTFLNILAPAVIEQHFTFGMTMPIGSDQELNLAVMIAPGESVRGANPFDGGATQIELEMEQKEIQVGWSWKY